MAGDSSRSVLLSGFSPGDERELAAALGALGRPSRPGDPVNDPDQAFVLAAAYDESSLRDMRAAAGDDGRPWAFCVPAKDRPLVAAAAAAPEGRLLLLPVDERELKRLLAALAHEAAEAAAGGAAFDGLARLEASFAWKSAELDVSRVCRSLAHTLAQAGYCRGRSGEDECVLALEEALVNALEHGNLELDSALRSDDLLAEDRYEAERAARLDDPAYGGRAVRVGLSIEGGEARITVADEGGGFDTSSLGQGPSGFEVSGKGYWLIKRAFDSVTYNAAGNELRLAKRKPQAR